ncbi:MAG: phage integrase N-terminal SAM-like domain-containing protein, partial [Candidatus Omnitrophica bacterium]|nr:phage integrase N-terminal SAM-like domain-containing protein [Candidatus Omnitrophota bacterium]
MRKRYREPKIYRKDGLYWFRITDSFGKRQEVRAFTDREAKLKRADMIKQLFSDLSGRPTYRITFEQGIEFWLKIKKGSIDETSYVRYSSHMDNFLEFIKTKRTNLRHFDEIRPEHIKEFMDYRLNEKRRATKTVNSERTALNNLFSVLIENKKIPEINPVIKVKPFKVIKVQKRRCLTDDELSKFFDGAKAESGSINWYGIYFTLYITGMRRDEPEKTANCRVLKRVSTMLPCKFSTKLPNFQAFDIPECLMEEFLVDIARGNFEFVDTCGIDQSGWQNQQFAANSLKRGRLPFDRQAQELEPVDQI